MWKFIFEVIRCTIILSITLWIKPMFPLGDHRWLMVAFFLFLLLYSREIFGWCVRLWKRKRIPGVQPPPLPKDRFQALSNKLRDTVTFDYSNDDGRYRIGEGEHMFTTRWTKGSTDSIHLYKGGNVRTVAVTDKQSIDEIEDASEYDGSSRHRTVQCGQAAVLQNVAGFWAAVKVLNIEDDTRGSDHDELMIEYVIQSDGTPNFKEIRP